MNIREALHAKRDVTEVHIKELQKEHREGIRYTAMMPDIPFLILALLCNVGLFTQLIASGMYLGASGVHSIWDALELAALAAVIIGLVIPSI